MDISLHFVHHFNGIQIYKSIKNIFQITIVIYKQFSLRNSLHNYKELFK